MLRCTANFLKTTLQSVTVIRQRHEMNFASETIQSSTRIDMNFALKHNNRLGTGSMASYGFVSRSQMGSNSISGFERHIFGFRDACNLYGYI